MSLTASSALVFAAGFGKRMGALTKSCPKPMLKVAGQPLIDRALRLVSDAGVTNVVVNLHYLADILASHLAGRKGVQLSVENPAPLETGGGLRHALPLLGPDPVFTFNPDAVWSGPNPLDLLAQSWDPERMDALLLLVPIESAAAHPGDGDFVASSDLRLQRAVGRPGQKYVYAGAQIMRTERLVGIDQTVFSLNVVWEDMIADGRLYGCIYDGGWVDVGTPEGISLAENMLSTANV